MVFVVYKQTQGTLTKRLDGEEYHCCLGVACKKYQEQVGDLDIEMQGINNKVIYYDGENSGLPDKVMTWLGISTDSGEYGEDGRYSLLSDNDDERLTFDQIADIIELEPPGLFD